MGKLVESTVNNKGRGKTNQKLAEAIITQAKKDEDEEAEKATADSSISTSESASETTEADAANDKDEEQKILKAIEEEAAAEAVGPDSQNFGKMLEQEENDSKELAEQQASS